MVSEKTVSLEVAIEVVLRNGPTFETIAGLCRMAVEAEREACAVVVDAATSDDEDWDTSDWNQAVQFCASRIRARSQS